MRAIRVLFGFVLACLAAAATLVLFVYTPAELASLPSGMGADRMSEAGLFALAVTPHVATFAALPALIGAVFAESRGISSWGYYAMVGIGIAVLGFLAQHVSEAPGQTSILHNYALTAFLTAGLTGGWAYWLFSGRYVMPRAGTPAREAGPEASSSAPHEA
ncbi:MAG: hypothetical protein K2X43_12455 [Hyphomonadaceae bacterium]|jgi:hypothetical protein|nr:hypothetical protein [Hyphomonadaceae bacterium]